MPQYLKDYGERLVALGYTVLPIKPGTKRPDLKNWPQHATTAADVVAWYSNGRVQHGAGINARDTPAIDVDVMDQEVADAMSEAIDRIFPGVSLMTRTGLAPKFLIPFRSDEPFRKLSSNVYTDGEHEHKVEILGDRQQWVAYHIHPDTEQPYAWCGLGDRGIVELEHDALPLLDRASAQRVIDAFEVLAQQRVKSGLWGLLGRQKENTLDSGHASRADIGDLFIEQPVGKSESEVVQLLKRHPNNEADYDHWFAVLAAVHHELGDAGREAAYEWSSSSAKHTDEKFDTTWNSLGRYPGRQITLRSLLKTSPIAPPIGQFVQAAQFASDQKVEWHVKHVIPKRGLIVVYGAPGSSKSFFVLDLVAHIARGLPWRGHRVKQSTIAYVAAEGVAGFGNRLAAYSANHGTPLSEIPIFVRGGQILLNESALEVADAVRQIGAGIVVIDTLAAVTPGANENTSEDMGQAINSANLILEATGASVILIHHANRQGEMRGWSGLLAAADNSIRIEHDEATGLRAAHVEKQKEGPSSGKYGYRLKVVDLGQDEDGDAVTSCAVEPCEEAAPNTRTAKKERKSTGGDFETSDKYSKARKYLQIIEDIIGLGDANVDEMDVVLAVQADEIVNPLKEPDHPRPDNIKRTLLTLAEHGKIKREGRWIRLCR